jgi:hypothetical protein
VLQSRLEVPELGSTAYNGYAWAGGLGVGAVVPLNEYFFVDAGASIDVVGPMRLSLHGALGIPIPLSHL